MSWVEIGSWDFYVESSFEWTGNLWIGGFQGTVLHLWKEIYLPINVLALVHVVEVRIQRQLISWQNFIFLFNQEGLQLVFCFCSSWCIGSVLLRKGKFSPWKLRQLLEFALVQILLMILIEDCLSLVHIFKIRICCHFLCVMETYLPVNWGSC